MVSLATLYTLYVENVLPPSEVDRYRIGRVIENWGLTEWLIFLVATAVLSFIIMRIVESWGFFREGRIEASGQSAAAGNIAQQGGGNTIQYGDNYYLQQPPPPRQISVPILPPAQVANPEYVHFIPNPRPPQPGGSQGQIRLILQNDTGMGLQRCFIRLREIAHRPTREEADWIVEEGLPSADPLRWLERIIDYDFLLCAYGADIAAGEQAAFSVVSQYRHRNPEEGQPRYAGSYTYCKDNEGDLIAEHDYRLQLQFTATGLRPVYIHLYLRVHDDGYWEYHSIERIDPAYGD